MFSDGMQGPQGAMQGALQFVFPPVVLSFNKLDISGFVMTSWYSEAFLMLKPMSSLHQGELAKSSFSIMLVIHISIKSFCVQTVF